MTLFGFWALTRPTPSRVVRLTVTPTGATALGIGGFAPHLAISPDGTRLAYLGAGAQQIFVRTFDQLEPTAIQRVGAQWQGALLPGTEWRGDERRR